MRTNTMLLAASTAVYASAQDLATVIASEPSLSMLFKLLGSVQNTTNFLASQKDVTLFAPNNHALSTILGSGGIFSIGQAGADPGLIEQILDYHLYKGVVESSDITTVPQFVSSYLDYSGIVLDGGESGSNVTGGQVVSVNVDGSGKVAVTSGLKQVSYVTKADLRFNNGIIHIIDKLLLIPMSVSETLTTGNFTGLAGALIDTDLVMPVEELSDVTIFVPNNDAFQRIAGGTAGVTMEALASILQYHVVQGTVGYSTALSNTTLTTLGGQDVEITITPEGAVFINSVRVINADLTIANGVMHVIDEVLIPGSPDAPQASSVAPSVPFATFFTPDPRFTAVYTELVETTSFVAAGLVTATPTATIAGNGSGFASSVTGVVQQTGNAGVKNELPALAAAIAGVVAFAL